MLPLIFATEEAVENEVFLTELWRWFQASHVEIVWVLNARPDPTPGTEQDVGVSVAAKGAPLPLKVKAGCKEDSGGATHVAVIAFIR